MDARNDKNTIEYDKFQNQNWIRDLDIFNLMLSQLSYLDMWKFIHFNYIWRGGINSEWRVQFLFFDEYVNNEVLNKIASGRSNLAGGDIVLWKVPNILCTFLCQGFNIGPILDNNNAE